MKKMFAYLPRLFLLVSVFVLASCGEDSTTQNVSRAESAMDDVADESLLPPCNEDNEGIVVLVKSDMLTRVCIDGNWHVPVSGVEVKYSCTTQELLDGSGVKVVCGGDSVGVVYSGADGDNGLNGDNCKVEQGEDSSQIIISCGEVSTTIILAYSSSSNKALSSSVPSSSSEAPPESSSEPEEDDSEPVSLDSLKGYSQKGPFVKGSIVNLYELADGRTLRQTNGNFVSTIKSDDGFFKIMARNLVSQYALLQATGYYRNEVSGKKTTAKLMLFGLTDVSARTTANVNLLTHLEYDRVYYRVTHDKLRFTEAKRWAQREILTAFRIDTAGVESFEDLNVVGSGKGDAALLAISILLQGDRDIAHLTELLSELSKDLEIDGEWSNGETRRAIAEWAMFAEAGGRYADFRKNVQSWGLSNSVPDFESILHHFWSQELFGKDLCDEHDEGEVFEILYDCNKRYFTCKDGYIRSADYWERLVGRTCSEKNEGESAVYRPSGANYEWKMLCSSGAWTKVQRNLSEGARIGTITDSRDGEVYKTVYIGKYNWMAEHLRFRYLAPTAEEDSSSTCSESECEEVGRRYFWSAAVDSTALANDPENPRTCGNGGYDCPTGFVRGICPEGWHLPTLEETNSLLELENVPYSLYALGSTSLDFYEKGEISPYITDVYGFAMKLTSYDARFWSAVQTVDDGAFTFCVHLDTAYVEREWMRYSSGYIRCVEDYED